LQGKTQILNLGDSDFYRTRLTHSLEVAQIAGGIAKQLGKSFPAHAGVEYLPDRSRIHAVGCTHDLGHPPFGHGGEVALNYCMRNDGGFEGNGQTLRILSRHENFSQSAGANLTRRTLLGVLKYPVPFSVVENKNLKPRLFDGTTSINIIDRRISKPPKCYLDTEQSVVDWIFENLIAEDRDRFTKVRDVPNKHYKPIHKSLDCSIMDVADDIAYGVHDLEDAIALKLISESAFRQIATKEKCLDFLRTLRDKNDEFGSDGYQRMISNLFGDSGSRKHYISKLVHFFICSVEFEVLDEFIEPLLKYRAVMKKESRVFLDALQGLVVQEVITSPSVQHLEFKGQSMVVSVFEALKADPERLLPREFFGRIIHREDESRVICDYVAGMTDHYLLRTYERLYSPRMGSVFDKL
jgi:dGTPase